MPVLCNLSCGLFFYHGQDELDESAGGYWEQDKNIINPLHLMQDVSYEPLMLCPSENP